MAVQCPFGDNNNEYPSTNETAAVLMAPMFFPTSSVAMPIKTNGNAISDRDQEIT